MKPTYTKEEMLHIIKQINDLVPKSEIVWDIRRPSMGKMGETTARDRYARALYIRKEMKKGATYEEAEPIARRKHYLKVRRGK